MASVDVVVPCYQYGRFLRSCVTSVLQQGIEDVRVLIIDNASTDNTLETALDLAAEDRRVEVATHRANLGHHASFNEGIDWASSDYFLLLCADDLLAPGSLMRAVSFMDAHPSVHFTFGRALELRTTDAIVHVEGQPDEVNWQILAGEELIEIFCRNSWCHICSPTTLVRTSVQKRAGYYRSALSHTDDVEMWLRLGLLGDAAKTNAVQGFMRLHPNSASAAVANIHEWNLRFEAAFESFFAKEGASMRKAKRLRHMAQRSLSERAYWNSLSHLLRGNIQLSWDFIQFAFARCPMMVLAPPIGYLFRMEDFWPRFFRFAGEVSRKSVLPEKPG